jgi:hypothetical protein
MLSFVMLSVIMLSVIMLSAFMLIVVGPKNYYIKINRFVRVGKINER